ncbi:MAG: hypothetical protein ACLVAW_14230 [Eisenbergiella massiliensis]
MYRAGIHRCAIKVTCSFKTVTRRHIEREIPAVPGSGGGGGGHVSSGGVSHGGGGHSR